MDPKSGMYLPLGTYTGVATSVKVKVKTAQELKFTNVVRQKLDYSCGSATVATIFNYYLGVPVEEEKVTHRMFEIGDKEKIAQRKGFSLLDMKRFAESYRFKAYGIKTDIKGLVKLNKPAIVTVVIGNYKHFVVFRGVYKGRVFIADPAFGNTILTPEEFERIWYKNIALVIEPKEGKTDNKLAITEKDMQTVSAGYLRGELVHQMLPTYRYSTDF
ncbi:C39 family peptidase [Hydrogenivirga caldilitoris]|nr:C39 family peptidase [Hydrogenivirga caldilitoris]